MENRRKQNAHFFLEPSRLMILIFVGTTMENWLEFGKTNPISLPWIDMGVSWWAIIDW